jgi:hypothetical protein
LNSYYVPDIVLGSKDILLPSKRFLYSQSGRVINQQADNCDKAERKKR